MPVPERACCSSSSIFALSFHRHLGSLLGPRRTRALPDLTECARRHHCCYEAIFLYPWSPLLVRPAAQKSCVKAYHRQTQSKRRSKMLGPPGSMRVLPALPFSYTLPTHPENAAFPILLPLSDFTHSWKILKVPPFGRTLYHDTPHSPVIQSCSCTDAYTFLAKSTRRDSCQTGLQIFSMQARSPFPVSPPHSSPEFCVGNFSSPSLVAECVREAHQLPHFHYLLAAGCRTQSVLRTIHQISSRHSTLLITNVSPWAPPLDTDLELKFSFPSSHSQPWGPIKITTKHK